MHRENDVPTRVSVGGVEYVVSDRCIDAPPQFAPQLADHGFLPVERAETALRAAMSKAQAAAKT